MVGSALLQQLLADDRFNTIKIFVRRGTGIQHAKLQEYIIDFDAPDTWQHKVTGDVLFSAFGTTLKKAGGKEAQYKIDYTYQYQMAEIAAQNGVKIYVLISAAGSSLDAKIFYSRMKGELERDVKKLPFTAIHIIRPGMLAGDRKESRPMEKVWIPVMKLIGMIPGLGSLKPVYDKQVAAAMIHAATNPAPGIFTYTLGEVFDLAEGKL